MTEYLTLRIPVLTLRAFLILATTSALSLFLLFPFTFLSFNFFYNYLIPTSTIILPFEQFVLNADHIYRGSYIVFSDNSQWPYAHHPNVESLLVQLDPELRYDFRLRFNPKCERYEEPVYLDTMYKISLISKSGYEKVDTYKEQNILYGPSLWPVTDEVTKDFVYLSNMNTLILNCKEEKNSVKKLFPRLIQGLIPEFVAEYEYLTPPRTVNLLSDIKVSEYISNEPWCIVLEFKRSKMVIDPSQARLEINVSWKGLRYYLYHYRLASYTIGVSFLWGLSTLVLFGTIGGLIVLREMSQEAEEEAEERAEEEMMAQAEKPVLQGDLNHGFVGNTGEIDFTVSVAETYPE